MKLNPDCMRDILISMENIPYQQQIVSDDLHKLLTGYSHDEIDYAILKMYEAGFVNAAIQKNVLGDTNITLIDITYHGHQFLADVQSDNIWNHIKTVSNKIGATSVNAFMQISTGVVSALIKNQLGI